jgi:triosephosphate isomerase
MTKKLFLGTNLKMYKTPTETAEYLKELQECVSKYYADVTYFVIPSYVCLPAAIAAVRNNDILLGAQNMYWEEKGQFTGEVSPLMLRDLCGISVIMVGHSERRHIFNETDEGCRQKVASALAHGFICLLCIGETEEEKCAGKSDEILLHQLRIGLADVKAKELDRVWVAYEPVWSIGVNGAPATSEYAQDKYLIIRQELTRLFGNAGKTVPVLYGGSVNLENAAEMIEKTHVDGLFIGRAAWNAGSFARITKSVLPIWRKRT